MVYLLQLSGQAFCWWISSPDIGRSGDALEFIADRITPRYRTESKRICDSQHFRQTRVTSSYMANISLSATRHEDLSVSMGFVGRVEANVIIQLVLGMLPPRCEIHADM